MKKVINTLLIVAVIVLGANIDAHSQGTKKAKVYRKALTTDPIDLFNSERFNVKYEQNIGKENSFTADLMYTWAYNSKEYTNVGIVLGGGYRWYFHNLSPKIRTRGIEGLAVGPFANLNYIRKTINEKNYSNDFVLQVGGEVTYKFVLFEGLAIEPALRLGWVFALAGSGYSTGFELWPGVSLGYAW